MFNNIKLVLQLILVAVLSSILFACGGGGGGSTPPPPAADTTAPEILVTNPASEQVAVKTNKLIEVTFSEKIKEITRSNVAIFVYVQNAPDLNQPVILENNPFTFDTATNKLTIKPKQGEIKPATTYQITLSDIYDIAGNNLANSCKWIFATTGSGAPTKIGIGNTNVCGKPVDGTKPIELPGEVQAFTATAGAAAVYLSWQVPITGSEPTYYKLDRSSDNQQSFVTIEPNLSLTTLNYPDYNLQNGTSYSYRIVSGNNIGVSAEVVSNSVIPQRALLVPGAPKNVSVSSGNNSVTLNWQESTTGDKTTYYTIDRSTDNGESFSDVNLNIPSTTFTYTDSTAQNGVAYEYRVFSGNDAGAGYSTLSTIVSPILQAPQILVSSAPSSTNLFGASVSFSSDGTSMAVGERISDYTYSNNNLKLYSKTGTGWTLVQQLKIQDQYLNRGFGGYSVFSPDGTSLIVSAYGNGDIYAYTKSGTQWVNPQRFGSNVGNSGGCLFFSPGGSILVACDNSGNINTNAILAGNVHLYKKVGSLWQETQVLSAPVPVDSNYYGLSASFSADGLTLAVGESRASLSTISNIGAVHLYTQVNGIWTHNQVLHSNIQVKDNYFGYSVAFSPVGNTLAVGEIWSDLTNKYDVGNVQLFEKVGSSWVPAQTLTSPLLANYERFGYNLKFNASGNTLAVAGIGFETEGVVHFFNLTGTTWTYAKSVTSVTPTKNNKFGTTISFSPDGSIIAIGETNGEITNGVTDSGILNIFTTSQFK